MGAPPHILNLVAALYLDDSCVISINGRQFQGFDVGTGIRQGCPLSPLLFAFTGDLLLRRLVRLLPDATLRMYANDLAMVLHRVLDRIAHITYVFEEFNIISCIFHYSRKFERSLFWE